MQEELMESMTGKNEIAGFGGNVVKIIDTTGKVICYIGKIENESKEFVYFPSPLPIEVIANVQKLLEKRKMKKALKNGQFDKAQNFVNRKWR
jgi:hypothetical protein